MIRGKEVCRISGQPIIKRGARKAAFGDTARGSCLEKTGRQLDSAGEAKSLQSVLKFFSKSSARPDAAQVEELDTVTILLDEAGVSTINRPVASGKLAYLKGLFSSTVRYPEYADFVLAPCSGQMTLFIFLLLYRDNSAAL